MELPTTPDWRHRDVELFLLEPGHVGCDYVRWLNDPRVNRYLESRFVEHTLDSTREFVRQCRADTGTLFVGIRSHALGGRHVGNVKLAPIDRRHGLGEIGILVGEPDAWGRGIASGALLALSAIAQRQLSLRKLSAGCYASNIGSRKAFEHAGFTVEGVRSGHFLLDGKPEDLVLLGRWLPQPQSR
jgi:RimJ/RimL family protein N-acetyltransferase